MGRHANIPHTPSHRRNHDEISGFGGFLLRIGAVELRDGLRQERASITDFHGLINQRVHIVLEQRAASAKAEQYWSGVKIVAEIAGVGGLADAGIASVARLG